jgi:hypothetical protein
VSLEEEEDKGVEATQVESLFLVGWERFNRAKEGEERVRSTRTSRGRLGRVDDIQEQVNQGVPEGSVIEKANGRIRRRGLIS